MIQIITTGGTIEGLDYKDENRTKSNTTISISKLLEMIPFSEHYIIQNVFSKDSRFIDDKDRNTIAEIIENSPNEKILITHGTLTMVETARYLGKLYLLKTIVLTGAFIPGTNSDSDATENLRFALSQLKRLSNGVYIAIQYDVFPWENVKKNTAINQFEKLN